MASRGFETFLKTWGNEHIRAVRVYRERVSGAIRTAINILSFASNPTLYHVYQVIQTMDEGVPRFYRIDKNQTVVEQSLTQYPKGEFIEIHGVPHVTINAWFAAGERYAQEHGREFWRYDAKWANCQLFVLDCLEGTCGKVSAATRDFIYQSVDMSIAAKTVAAAVTGAASAADKVYSAITSPFSARPPATDEEREAAKIMRKHGFGMRGPKSRTDMLKELKVLKERRHTGKAAAKKH